MSIIFKKSVYRGFSLLELILAIAIFSLGSVVLGTLVIEANLSTKSATDMTTALFYAKEGIEAARTIRDNDWASLTDGNHGLTTAGGSWEFNGSDSDLLEDDKYTRVIGIETDGGDAWLKTITSTVSWNLIGSRNVSVVLTTNLTNWVDIASSTTP